VFTNANLQVAAFVVALLILVKPLGIYRALAAEGRAPLLSRIEVCRMQPTPQIEA
jgi:potassium-transporting ATPase potassium-binding subunit